MSQHHTGPLRHRRVWLSPAITDDEVTCLEGVTAVAALLDWVRRGRPLVGRARNARDPDHGVPLGLALPPRRRLAFAVPATRVERIDPPLTLAEALPTLPSALRDIGAGLAHAARERAMPLFVYGSVFWQQASGEPYLHDHSDLDLLAQPADSAGARSWLSLMREADAETGGRVDGEIELPSHGAVAWRELDSGSERLLVKSDLGPSLQSRAQVWSQWPDHTPGRGP